MWKLQGRNLQFLIVLVISRNLEFPNLQPLKYVSTCWNKSCVHAGSGYVLKTSSVQSFLKEHLTVPTFVCRLISEEALLQLIYKPKPMQRALVLSVLRRQKQIMSTDFTWCLCNK